MLKTFFRTIAAYIATAGYMVFVAFLVIFLVVGCLVFFTLRGIGATKLADRFTAQVDDLFENR